jgi:hypothetical protein
MRNRIRGISIAILGWGFCAGLSGCATTHRVPLQDTLAQRDLDSLGIQAGKSHADVKLKDGHILLMRKVKVSSESISVSSLKGKPDSTWTLREVESITFAHHGMGAGQGMISGFMTGMGLGYGMGLASGDSPDREEQRTFFGEPQIVKGTTAAEKAGVGAALGGVFGGLLGAMLGGAIGARDEFLFTVPAPKP